MSTSHYTSNRSSNLAGRVLRFDVDPRQYIASRVVKTQPQCALSTCNIERTKDGTPLLLCSGCKVTRYCSPAHQSESWPAHKAFCKKMQKIHNMQEFMEAQLPPQLADQHARRQFLRDLLVDWIELHQYILIQGIAVSIRAEGPFPVKHGTKTVTFSLKYREESEDPAMSFRLMTAVYKDKSLDEWGCALPSNATSLHTRDAQCRKDADYMGTILCSFDCDGVTI